MKSRIVASVHDIVELISPQHEVEKICEIIYDEMVNYPFIKDKFNIQLNVPLEIEILVGNSFGDGEEIKLHENAAVN